MKKFRKMIGMIMSVLMLWTAAVSVAAEQFTIRIINTRVGETYRIYRMMDVSVNSERDSYSYTIADGWDAFFSTGGAGNAYITMENGYITGLDSSKMEEFGKKAAAYVKTASPAEAAPSVTGPQSEVIVFDLSSPGYYLITSTAGSLVSIETTPQSNTVTVTEKTKASTISCEQLGKNPDKTTAMIDAQVQYRNTITIQKGAVNEVMHVETTDGMTFDRIDSITVNGMPLTENTDYQLIYGSDGDSCDLHVRFTKDWLDGITASTEVEVTYSVHLNDLAATKPDTETMRTWLSEGEVSVTGVISNTLSTLFFDLIKVESVSEQVLEGACFELYTAAVGGERIDLVKESAGVYHIATAQEKSAEGFTSAVIEAGRARIKGFCGYATAYLEEIKAPDGYNKVASRIEVTFLKNNKETTMTDNTWKDSMGGIGVLNSKGAVLPATGGEGNTFFYLFGGALCIIGGIAMLRLSTIENE